MSLVSKYDETIDFYTLLNAFIDTHEATTTETKNRKDRIMNNVKPLYNKYFDTYRKNYNTEKVKDKEKRGHVSKQFEIIDKKKQQKSEWTEEKTKTEIQKPLWFKINKKEFHELTRNIYNNQDNNDFKLL